MASIDPATAASKSAPEAGAATDTMDASGAPNPSRWHEIAALFRSLPAVETPIFPGPIPDRRAPPVGRGVRAQLEPVRPLPSPAAISGAGGARRGSEARAPSGAATGGAGAAAAASPIAPPRPVRPRACVLYTRSIPLRPPARRRDR